ncbi:MAG: NAD(P)/FAD-dependent oxidoreductase [Thermococcus sp.]|uniref:geranylgeranyl reductase family protein n=1 Tax=Thermococcus sp. TaxID=35749 RepID=UPI001DF6EF13|nr:NAD(P)/FAD-dependent oxidoreductase [Thermococcus sp.]MBO8175295.1 NAD(P)/FAD-dependent oxidoreductase [Thermococcus sp.]
MKYDIAIIGGGPVGNYLATLLGRHYKVAVIEAKSSFGGKACTGIIGAKSYEELKLPKDAIINKLRGAVFYSKIQSFEIKRKEPQAYMVDRKILEKSLAERAVKRGAEYYMNTRFLGFRNGKAVLQRFNDRFEINADFYIGADGVNSKVAQEIGARTNAEFLSGYEVEIVGEFEKPDFVELWINKELNGDFFFWVTPINESLARVGTFGRLDTLFNFIKVRMLKETNIVEFKAGSVALGIRKPWIKGNVALVGDAALQIKPLTAGGIAYGMYCAYALAYSLINGKPEDYERLCKNVKREISFGLKARRLFKNLNQEQIEKLFELLSSREAIEVIESTADFDEHAKTIKALIKHPKLLARALKVTPMIIRYLL